MRQSILNRLQLSADSFGPFFYEEPVIEADALDRNTDSKLTAVRSPSLGNLTEQVLIGPRLPLSFETADSSFISPLRVDRLSVELDPALRTKMVLDRRAILKSFRSFNFKFPLKVAKRELFEDSNSATASMSSGNWQEIAVLF